MTPKEKVLKYIDTQYHKERDKWEAGFKNQYYAWDDLYNEIKPYLAGDDYQIIVLEKRNKSTGNTTQKDGKEK